MYPRGWSICSAEARLWSRSPLLGASVLACGFLAFTVQGSSPGTCLQFNGTNGYVSVAHNAALNAYPLTITAWIKTLHNASPYDGIVSKYPPGGYDGFSFFVWQGHARAWYFHNSSSYIWNPQLGQDAEGVDGGFVADGNWHQVAFVVSSTSGTIYVDGNVGGSIAWTGSAGPPTTNTVALLLGRGFLSPSFPNTFAGQIDEVTMWNRALTPNELNYLKHRSLAGKEEGLLAYWRLDEGSGAVANDSGPNAFNGTIVPDPAWVPSQAAVVLDPIATNCLKFDGANGYVQVPHDANLNAYPFTAAAWFRTSDTANVVQGIVSKYMDASGNGWSVVVQNSHLRAFYYRTFSNYAVDVTSAASVADGDWHHAALTVDASGGKLFLDGAQVGAGSWVGGAGAPTGTEPLQIGRYYTYAQRFLGTIDEVTVWSRALAASEIAARRNLPLAGNEANLVAYWRLDESTGTITKDATGHGYNGSLISSPIWTGSTAYLGDGSVHLVAAPSTPNFTRQYAVATGNGSLNSFSIAAGGFLRRFYDFGPAPASLPVVTHLDGGLQVAGVGTTLAVSPDTASSSFTMSAYNASSPQPIVFGSVASVSAALNVQPASGVQLDSVNNLHNGVVTLSHSENGGSFLADGSDMTDPARLLHFDGTLFFGTIQTLFTSIANAPTPGVLGGGGIASQLAVNNNSGTLTANPAYHYGNGATLSVTLLSNGDALAASGTTVPLTGSDSGCLQNICFTRSGLTLSNSAIQGTVTLQLPLGLSVCTNFNNTNRIAVGLLPFGRVLMDPSSLNPLPSSLTAPGPLYVVEETKPFWMRTPSLTWQLNAGQIVLAGPLSALFVRQEDDDQLTASVGSPTPPVDASMVKRISNDGYYRNASNVLSGQVIILADTNGAAQMNVQLALNPPELRPHFPYTPTTSGSQIPTAVGGQLIIANGLVDTVNSSLPVGGALPVTYARDCFDTNCGQATIAAAVIPFTPNGNALTFTPDGGLLAYGSMPATGLTWGYAGNGNYAQQTSPLASGAYEMAGTFMRNDQAPAAADPAAVLLLAGFGDAANPSYQERPSQTAYSDGFANYPGLNLRAPAQGRSFVAQQDTGFYSLTTRSKYYVRYGGVSGIHESLNSIPALALYGYPFTFTSYRLSYLDSENWESRTDGSLALPIPAGFPQEFARMKFVCKGDLDSAQVPPSSGVKHMVYWTTDITPQSIEFHPTNNDVCGTSPRFLVLGVETRLPFLGQAFHATLGFKNNGNLVTVADNVAGCDSRFQVPGNLTLQGPGGSTFPLLTAGDGYFNNWETTGKPANGFFNVVGKMRVPFFSDIKTHLHVTPKGSSTAQIDIMGGWPAADSNDPDRGWSIGGSNFFNTAKFDQHADGWPQTLPDITAYRQSASDPYHPRAQRNWIDVAKFNYPLQWNPVLHQFAGLAPAPVVLPVIDVNSRLKQLSPGKVDFDFYQDLSLQLPEVKVLDFANDALNEINGPINTVSNAIRQEVGSFFNTTGLTSGFRSLQSVLREDVTSFFQPILQPALSNTAHQIYVQLAAVEQTSPSTLLTSVGPVVTAAGNGLQTAIQGINGVAGQANTVFGKVDQVLSDVDDTIGLFLRVLEKDSEGNRHVVRVIIEKLVQDQGPALGIVASISDNLANSLLTDLEPTLAEVESELQDLRDQFAQLRTQIDGTVGDFTAALNSAQEDLSAVNNYLQQASSAVSNLLSTVVTPASNYFTDDPAAAEQAILDRLMVAFISSPMPAGYQQTFRQFMFDDNFALDQLMNVLFDQINRSIRDGIDNQMANSGGGIYKAMKGIGQMGQAFLSAKIRGAPTFEGDSLRAIHLDSAVQMNLPDEMHFNAYMDVKELTSSTTAMGCIPPGAPAAEVTLGAKDVPLSWPGVSSSSPMTLTVEGRWTLQNGSVLGIGGLLDIKGEAGFKGCTIKEIGADFAIGQMENYFAAKAVGTITVIVVPVDVQVGIFAGHACTLDPLRWIDPNVDKVLDHATDFSGLYLQYGGSLDLAEILFGTSSCFLDVRAGITTAVYYQGGPRSGKIGFRQEDSVDLDLACVISGHVDYSLGASVSFTPPTDYEIDVVGDANLCGSLGYCPFCIQGCKGITVKGIVKDGHIDYHIDGP